MQSTFIRFEALWSSNRDAHLACGFHSGSRRLLVFTGVLVAVSRYLTNTGYTSNPLTLCRFAPVFHTLRRQVILLCSLSLPGRTFDKTNSLILTGRRVELDRYSKSISESEKPQL